MIVLSRGKQQLEAIPMRSLSIPVLAGILIPVMSCTCLVAGEKPKEVSGELKTYLAKGETDIEIGRGALLIAREVHPALDIASHLKTLDRLGEKLAVELTRAGSARARLDTLKSFLFEVENYRLPTQDDASSFLLPDVLKNKRGNCLGLSVLCLALAERAGLKLHGVPVPSRLSGPGHLLVRYDDGRTRINFDPTEKGAAHPDDHYRKLFKLRPAEIKKGYILGNATAKDVLNLLLVNLGGDRVVSGRAEDALPLLRQAIAVNPKYAPAYNNLGAAHLELGDWENAEKAYRKAIELDPGFVAARTGIGTLALRKGNAQVAEEEAMLVLAAEPENIEAKGLLANVYLTRGEYRAARGVLAEIVRAQPKNVRARCNLGTALRMAGDYEEAELSFRKALEMDSKCADAHFGLGQVANALGRKAEARRAFVNALKIDPHHVPTHLAQARTAQKAGKFPLAQAGYDAVLKSQPQHLEALGGLAEVLLAQRKFVEAEKRLLAVAKAHPGNFSITMLLGEVKMGRGDSRGALALLQAALKNAPKDARVPLKQRIAVCYGKLRNHRKAWETAEEILKDNPSDLVALRIAAAACEGFRNRVKAIQYYKRILALDPNDVKAKKAIARLGSR